MKPALRLVFIVLLVMVAIFVLLGAVMAAIFGDAIGHSIGCVASFGQICGHEGSAAKEESS